MQRWLLGMSALTAAALLAGVALAWSGSALVQAKVWDHEFSEIQVQSSGCVLSATLKYSAPQQAYESRIAGMNQYRFRARTRFASGKSAASSVFTSTKPGSRSHRYEVDTTREGCWARHEQTLRGVDVEGCRGEGCQVEPFK